MRALLFAAGLFLILSCNNNATGQTNNTGLGATDHSSATTEAVRDAGGADTNAYNLPGTDTAAIHKNTNEPGVLDKDAQSKND